MKNILYSIFLVYVLGMPLLAQVPRVVHVPPTLSRMEVQLLRQARQAGKAAPLWAEQMNLALETNALAEQKRLTELVERVPFFAQSPAELTRLSKTGRVQLTPSELRPVFTPEDLAQTPAVASVFQVRGADDSAIRFSGAVIKAEVDGKTQIFGVMAAHPLASTPESKAPFRHFKADVFINGHYWEVPAQVVQVGAWQMTDMALVKFPPEIEMFLTPLVLRQTPVQVGDKIQLVGMAHQKGFAFAPSPVMEITPLTLRFPVPYVFVARIGLCGSPVVSEQQEMVGMHIGSRFGFSGDTGLVLKASYIRKMIEGYVRGEEEPYLLQINGHTLARLQSHEYISQITLFDEEGKELARQAFDGKFSYTAVKDLLAAYPAKSIALDIGQVRWQDNFVVFEGSARGVIYKFPDEHNGGK